KELLSDEFQKEYFLRLVDFLELEYEQHLVYPPFNRVFEAFKLTPVEDVKVVILGQDPYHGEGQAHGLSFSVPPGMKAPPSLRNIFKELSSDLGEGIPLNNSLEQWAEQGVLMLNSTLTVRAKSPGSHQNKGWEEFTDTVIQKLSKKKENLVFVLWGSYAKKKGAVIDSEKHLIIESSHPSPFSAHKGFLGSKVFSKINENLRNKGLNEISWV
ncbi:MAG: uracil-DNA glycosylase, partial [Glaciecola sp.]